VRAQMEESMIAPFNGTRIVQHITVSCNKIFSSAPLPGDFDRN
jgi:hypothetical protein